MPLYEYQCQACGARFELIRKFADPPLEECAKCGKGPVDRLVSSPAFQFKGSGFYATDYAQKEKKSASGTTKTESKKDDAGGESTTKSDKSEKSEKSEKSDTATTPAPAPTTKE